MKFSLFRFISLIIAITSPLFIFADKTEASKSLYNLQHEIENNDFSKGNDSIELAKQSLLKNKLDSFILFYEPNKQYVRSLTYYAKYIAKEDSKRGLALMQKAEHICEQNNYDTLMAFISHDIGSIYFSNDLLNEAYTMYVESTQYFEKVNDFAAYGYALIDIGNIYYRKGQWTMATDYYLQSVPIFQKVLDKNRSNYGLSLAYDNLGQVFGQKMVFDTALYYLKLSSNIRHQNNLEATYYNSYLTISSLFLSINNLDSALYYNKKAIDICKKHNQKGELAFSYYAISNTYFKIDTAKALESLYKSIAIAKESSTYIFLRSNFALAEYYYDINIDSTLYYNMLVFNKSKEYNSDFYFKNSTNYLVDIYNRIGNDREEVKYLRLKVESLLKNKEKELFKTELLNEAGRWNKERAVFREQQKQNADIRNLQTVTVILVVLFSFFLFRAQRKLRKTAKQLETSNLNLQETIRTKDVVYSIVAHDLRGPVGAQLELVKLIDDDAIDAESFLEVVPTIRKSMQSTYNLLENLLSWAQLNKHEVVIKNEAVKLFDIVHEVEKILEDIAKAKNIEIINDVNPEIFVNADRNSISTVIRNLISNAIKFTNKGGKITIQSTINKDIVEVSVNDTGSGMSKEIMNSIFDKDKIVTNLGTDNEKGSGLGLKLCWEFVQLNNGTIWVESEEGVGSTFRFTLPKKNKL